MSHQVLSYGDRMKRLNAQARQVGQKFYEKISEADKTVIAFGMTPLPIVEMFETGLRLRIAKTSELFNASMTPREIDALAKAVKAEVISECTKNFILGLFDSAKAAKMMCA